MPVAHTQRTFIAVPLPEALRTSLFEARTELARHVPAINWARKVENLHVTIKFLGSITDDELSTLGRALRRELVAIPAFDAGIDGLGGFPSSSLASVIWAGVEDPQGGLSRVAAVVGPLTHGLGDARDGDARPFRAHVTLGRSRGGADLRPLLALGSKRLTGGFTVEEVHVYESQPGREGSTYFLRHRAPLGPRGRAPGQPTERTRPDLS